MQVLPPPSYRLTSCASPSRRTATSGLGHSDAMDDIEDLADGVKESEAP